MEILSLGSSVAYPFTELPQSLVKEMLNQCTGLSHELSTSFGNIINKKDNLREKLLEKNYLMKDTDFPNDLELPTTCGVDGSFIIENLLSVDVLAVAGVAVEGLIPPKSTAEWERPHHLSKIYSISHSDSTRQVAGALMMCMELELASKAPHNIVFFDGSLSTPVVHFKKALNALDNVPEILKQEFLDQLPSAIKNYKKLLEYNGGKSYVGVPKYTTKKEICKEFNMLRYEDRGLLSFVLEGGELIFPYKMDLQDVAIPINSTGKIFHDIERLLNDSFVFYYRPSRSFPVIRLEIMKPIVTDQNQLSLLFQTLKLQCDAPGMFEPFPLYLADRMVKHLRVALPALRKAATQNMTRQWDGDVNNVYLAMHGYRSKWG
ncbi:MAG: DNA double-strand break repair nuclease NurA [Promethearchaeota archaeon]